MKTKFLGLLVLAASMAVSCSDKGNDVQDLSDNDVPVTFMAELAASGTTTKVSGTSWETGDKVGIFMVKGTTTDIAENAVNRTYQWVSGNTFATVAGNIIYYPMDNSAVNFIGYYPYNANIASLGEYPVNTGDQSNRAAIDLLYAKSTSGYTKDGGLAGTKAQLAFYHQLALLKLNLTKGDGISDDDLSNVTVKIEGLFTTCAFNLADASISALADKKDIELPLVGTTRNAIVIPSEYGAGTVKVHITIKSGEVFTWMVNPDEATAFAPDTQYEYSISVNRTGIGEVECSISPWSGNEESNGIAW